MRTRSSTKPGIAGVYVIFGPGNRVYVGQSHNVIRRPTVDLARRLGLDWAIVRYMEGSSRSEREKEETRIHKVYQDAGHDLVSISPKETIRRAHSAVDFDERSQQIRDAWVRHPEWRIRQSEKMRKQNAARTPESRSDSARKAWATRRAQDPIAVGTSRRTQQRRRAAAARRI